MLDQKLNDKMIDEVSNAGYPHVKYIRYTSNGEPLVHPKSYDMIYNERPCPWHARGSSSACYRTVY